MALKVKANEKLQKIGTFAGTYRYVMKSCWLAIFLVFSGARG